MVTRAKIQLRDNIKLLQKHKKYNLLVNEYNIEMILTFPLSLICVNVSQISEVIKQSTPSLQKNAALSQPLLDDGEQQT